MPAYKDGKYISIPAEGALVASIERYAAEHSLALGTAAAKLAERGLFALAMPEPADRDPHDGTEPSARAWLEQLPNAWLAHELERRMGAGVSDEAYGEAKSRADAAEAKLAIIAATIGSAAA